MRCGPLPIAPGYERLLADQPPCFFHLPMKGILQTRAADRTTSKPGFVAAIDALVHEVLVAHDPAE